MDSETMAGSHAFIRASEVWERKGDRLVHAGGNYGTLKDFGAASADESFGKGEGLPGNAWSQERPVVLKQFEGSYFKRKDAAMAAGLTSAVAVPVFNGADLKAVLVVFCSDGDDRMGAIEVWREEDGFLSLADGYFGAAKEFEFVSQHTQFPRGQGLPGGVWAAEAPMLMRDLGSGYRFVRAESAGQAGLTTGLGVPVPVPSGELFVVTLLSARGTPIANRFEIWQGQNASSAGSASALMVDGLCERDGPIWSSDEERRITAWQGPVGQALASGIPVVQDRKTGLDGYDSLVAHPVHRNGAVAHVVNWYC